MLTCTILICLNDASVIAALHTQGRKVVCYVSVGSWEDWRPDADRFPTSVIGEDYEGWPGENWLDIRQIELLAPVMRARLDLCRVKGFDGIEPDNIDGYTQRHRISADLRGPNQVQPLAGG